MKYLSLINLILLFCYLPQNTLAQQSERQLLQSRVKVPKEIQGRWYSEAHKLQIYFKDYGMDVDNQFWIYHDIKRTGNEVIISVHNQQNIKTWAGTTIILNDSLPDRIRIKCGAFTRPCKEDFIVMHKSPVNPETPEQFKNLIISLIRYEPINESEHQSWRKKYQNILQNKLTPEWFEHAKKLNTFPELLQGFWNSAPILPEEIFYDTFKLAIFPNSTLQEYFKLINGGKNTQSGFINIESIYEYKGIYLCSGNATTHNIENMPFLLELKNDSLLVEPLHPAFYNAESLVFTNKQKLKDVVLPKAVLGDYFIINGWASRILGIKLYTAKNTGVTLSKTNISAGEQQFPIRRIFQNHFYPSESAGLPAYTILALNEYTDKEKYFSLFFDKSFDGWKVESLFPEQRDGKVMVGLPFIFRKPPGWSLKVKEESLGYIIIFFPLLILFLIIGFVIWLTYLRRKRKQAQLALRGLRAQLNPHFIFNALSSIQSLVNQQNIESANLYLSGFSKLMRHTLDNSGQDYLPLQEEMDALEQYCQLESLRSPFTYHIEIDPAIDIYNAEIPNMLLQPFVENAILHGLRDHPGQPLLEISIFKQGKKLVCIIADNGPGMQATQEREKSLHVNNRKQHGMKLSEERIQLLNMRRWKKISLQVLNRQMIENQAGTKVVIMIPE